MSIKRTKEWLKIHISLKHRPKLNAILDKLEREWARILGYSDCEEDDRITEMFTALADRKRNTEAIKYYIALGGVAM